MRLTESGVSNPFETKILKSPLFRASIPQSLANSMKIDGSLWYMQCHLHHSLVQFERPVMDSFQSLRSCAVVICHNSGSKLQSQLHPVVAIEYIALPGL